MAACPSEDDLDSAIYSSSFFEGLTEATWGMITFYNVSMMGLKKRKRLREPPVLKSTGRPPPYFNLISNRPPLPSHPIQQYPFESFFLSLNLSFASI